MNEGQKAKFQSWGMVALRIIAVIYIWACVVDLSNVIDNYDSMKNNNNYSAMQLSQLSGEGILKQLSYLGKILAAGLIWIGIELAEFKTKAPVSDKNKLVSNEDENKRAI